MKINHHNYEYYFLMYIDNELSEQEKEDVIEFIAKNPNFEKKLLDLQQTKIYPSEIIFENKLSLYQLSTNDLNCINYLDNEMSLSEKNAFEENLSNNSLSYAKLQEWQKTILPKELPNKLDFAFKKSLYKKEAIILPIWNNISLKRSASIAAIFLLALSVNIYQKTKRNNNFNSIVQTDKNLSQKSWLVTPNDLKENQENNIKSNNTNNRITKIAVGIESLRTQQQFAKNNSQFQIVKLHNNIPKNIQLQITQDEFALDKTSPSPLNNIAVISQIQEAEINTIQSTLESLNQTSNASSYDLQDEIKNSKNEVEPHQIQYFNIDTEEEDRNINIANLEIDGAKFRALGRKITTLLRRNKPENDKYK